MQYFSVPICPYCKKRVNVIRTWSLKKEGEYRCPRCQGISNIFLSPLIYVFALVAVFAGAAIFFFHRFILNDVNPSIIIQIILPFAVFFLLSLFMVNLQKPVIKKVSREEVEQKGRRKPNRVDNRRSFESASGPLPDNDAYLPQTGDPADAFATGPVRMGPPVPRETDSFSKPIEGELSSHTAVVDLPRSVPIPPRRRPLPGVPEGAGKNQSVSIAPATSKPAAGQKQPAPAAPKPPVARPAVPPVEYASKTAILPPSGIKTSPQGKPEQKAPVKKDDYFAKYEDPAYIEKRLEDMRNNRK